MDRRMYSRINLKHPLPCTCRIGQDEPLSAYVVNVSIMGLLLEVPDLKERLMLECCQRVSVDEGSADNDSLFPGLVGTLNWVYKNYIGVEFDHALKSSNKELRAWLRENDQLCEEAS